MAKQTKRRSISVHENTHHRLYLYAEKHGRSVSGVVEELVTTFLNSESFPLVTGPAPKNKKLSESQQQGHEDKAVRDVRSHFTF